MHAVSEMWQHAAVQRMTCPGAPYANTFVSTAYTQKTADV